MRSIKASILLPALTLAVLVPTMAAAAAAQEMRPLIPPDIEKAAAAAQAAAEKAGAAAPHVVDTYGVAPLATLPEAAVAEPGRLAALRAWNEANHQPLRNGISRPLPAVQRVELDAALLDRPLVEHAGGMATQTSFESLAWGGAVKVAQADRLRLHLAGVHLPPDARIWVHGSGGSTVGPFGPDLLASDGGLWTPSVSGETVAIDVELPAAALARGGRYGFTIDRVLELLPPAETAGSGGSPTLRLKDMSCNVDASCFGDRDFPSIDAARHALARIEFVDGTGQGALCSAQLLNDTLNDQTPYLLTANHCISTQDSAASIDAAFDFFTTSCNGQAPALTQLPHSHGARLLATGSADKGTSDYTLLRLNNLPGGRTFLGWNADPNAAADGTLLYRLSHPGGLPQNFVVTRSSSSVPACGGDRPTFLYSTQVTGGTFAGSSGSAALLANGEVVGQEFGGCGNANDCSPLQFTIDGAFAHSFLEALSPFLSPVPAVGGCRAGSTTLCLMNRRFQATVTWTNQFNGSSGTGSAIPSTDSTGFFYFTDPSNFELILKILNFGTVIKVFYGELTNLHFTITVTDTKTGTVKHYTNAPGDCGTIDEMAFAPDSAKSAPLSPPAAPPVAKAGGSCIRGTNTLCLLNRRLAVSVNWQNQFNNTSGPGAAAALSDESGLFSFNDPSAVELVLKALDFGTAIKFFWGTLSDLGYAITVTDTVTGAVKSYKNNPGNYCGGIDNAAFTL
ncbi:MAG TPA: serine protease [Thermoanaerobaculia bacterium]|nr:serine protease [Thermoanaerobaculia bacterium]